MGPCAQRLIPSRAVDLAPAQLAGSLAKHQLGQVDPLCDFLAEHPEGTRSFEEARPRAAIVAHELVMAIKVDQCSMGQADDQGRPLKKPSLLVGSCVDALAVFVGCVCPRHHETSSATGRAGDAAPVRPSWRAKCKGIGDPCPKVVVVGSGDS